MSSPTSNFNNNINYTFNFSNYINEGFKTFGERIGMYFLYILMIIVITYLIGLVPILGGILNNILVGPALSIGLYVFSNNIRQKKEAQFTDFFTPFKNVGGIVMVTLLMYGIYILSFIPFMAILIISYYDLFQAIIQMYSSQNPDPSAIIQMYSNFPFWSLIFLLPFLYVAIILVWSAPLVYFFNLAPVKAIRLSIKTVHAQFGRHLLFFIVVGLIMLSGILALFFGILFTIPAGLVIMYTAFQDIFQLNSEQHEPHISENLVTE